MTRVSAFTFSKQVGEQETVKYGVIQFIDCINNLAVFVDVCPYYIMYSFVRLKKILGIILFTPTHTFLRDEQPFLGILTSKESELFLWHDYK